MITPAARMFPSHLSVFIRVHLWPLLLFSGIGLLACVEGGSARQPADLVLRNGAVYTVDAARGWAQAVAVRGGRIVYVGPDSGLGAMVGSATRVVDLHGKMVLPGFHDTHVHLLSGGIELRECALYDFVTPTQVLDHIRECASENPSAPWVKGNGWQLPVFPDANPSKTQLDAVIPDRPAYFDAMDGHSAWVNSKALELAGVTKATPDPPNGRIERDRTGEPTGTLREAAMDLVGSRLPTYTAEDYAAGLQRGLREAARFGITSFFEADEDSLEVATYAAFDRRGDLTARVVGALGTDSREGPEQIERLKVLRALNEGKRYRPLAAKIFEDGVIESRTAALLEPYLDSTGYRGTPEREAASLDSLVTALDRAGFQIHMHTIGDRAIRLSLDALEAAWRANGVHDARPILAHLELIDPQDIPRFRDLGVIAGFQPFWAFPDDYITELTEPKLGPTRSRWLYPIQSVVASGAVVAAGSDWSVSSLNPLDGIQVAVTRRLIEDSVGPDPRWTPQERVDLPAIIAAYTINGAYAMRQERETGSIEVGKAADLVVLDRNLFQVPTYRIHEAKVVLTLLEGEVVFGHLGVEGLED